MSQNFTKISGSGVKFSLTISKEDFERAQKNVIQHHKSEVSVKGFRKGHAPENMVIAALGIDRLASEALDVAFRKHYQAFLNTEKINPVARPDVDFPEKIEFPIKISVSVEVFPEYEVKGYKDIKIKKEAIKVESKEIEDFLKGIMRRESLGVKVDRAAKKGDLIEADFLGKDEKGATLPGTELKKARFEIGFGNYLEDLEKAFEGMKAGDSKQSVPVKFPKDYHAPHFANKTVPFDIVLHEVLEIDPKGLSESIIEKMLGKKGTFTDLQEAVQKSIEHQKKHKAEEAALAEYHERLAEKVKGELPASWINREVDQAFSRIEQNALYQKNPEAFFKAINTTEAEFKKDLAKKGEIQIRSYLGLRFIVEQENISLDKEELEAATQRASAEGLELEQLIFGLKIDKYLRGLMLEA